MAGRVRCQHLHRLFDLEGKYRWKLDEFPNVLVVEFEQHTNDLASVGRFKEDNEREEEFGQEFLRFFGSLEGFQDDFLLFDRRFREDW